MNSTHPPKESPATPIAIIGMGCLFPGSRGLTDFWRFIRTGEDGITEVPDSHWRIGDYFDADPQNPDMTYCRRGGFLPASAFDPLEFGIPPTAIEATDTAQLLGLMVARQAMEDAGYGDDKHADASGDRSFDRERTSVILGVTGTLELALSLGARLGHPIWRRALREAGVPDDVADNVVARIADGYVPWQENSFPGLLGNVVAGRIANRLNLRGTNCVVDAACASALGAIHLAVLELTAGRSDMVLTGGVDTLNDIFMFMCFSKTPALSPTGDARPFSSEADGTVIGEGLGMVVLKRLADAERDGDRIYAVIRGVGSSSDGRSQSIYAPHSAGQARSLRNAYRLAGINPTTVELVEAHGTGTKVGDAAEFDALRAVFRESRAEGRWCGIGSVKSQIGHTKAAAGAAGLIKAALAIHNRVLPPTIKVRQPNPRFNIDDSPFYLNSESRPWFPSGDHPRRAGVSSFGFGGSNFHLVLEEHPAFASTREPAWDGSVQIIALSEQTTDTLLERIAEWHAFVDEKDSDPMDLARRAAASRRSFAAGDTHRLVFVLEHGNDLGPILAEARRRIEAPVNDSSGGRRAWSTANTFYGCGAVAGSAAALFPGQGSQYVNMGRDLACVFPEVYTAMADAASIDGGDRSLTRAVYPPPAFDEPTRQAQQDALTQTNVAQPALGALSAGLFRVLERFGFRPAMTAGHSFGELVALWTSGRCDAATLRGLSRLRGKLMASGDGDRGTMLAVHAPLDEIDALLATERLDVVLANRNAPRQGILSGSRDAIERVAQLCRDRGFRIQVVQVAAAFHSPFMQEASKRFRRAMDEVEFQPGAIPVLSNATGQPYPAEPAAVRDLLADQLVRPVRFVDEVEHLYDAGVRTFVEIGPRAVLTGLVKAILRGRPHEAAAVDASAGRRPGLGDLARVLARLAAASHAIDLTRWERPVPETRKPKMVVPLVGANYRSTRRPETATPPEQPAVSRTPCADADAGQMPRTGCAGSDDVSPKGGDPNVTQRTNGSQQNQPIPPTATEGPPTDHRGRGVVADAMRVVEEGLRAMQSLQQQTAAAHERFLQGQEEAQKAFLRVLESQQQLLEHGGGPVSRSTHIPAPTAERDDEPARPLARTPVDTTPVVEPAATLEPPTAAQPAPTSQSQPSSESIDSLVLEVVSEKTGYPVEMLDADMDIEADLGIDSIKRVEIVAAIEERAPHLTAVRPEHMGSLRTLREIISFMSSGGARPGHAEDTQPTSPTDAGTAPPPPPAAPAPTETIGAGPSPADVLLSVVSELTGYPAEMLELDMDLEADLGIDSIKRVEILAAVEARVPEFRTVNPEYLGSLRTLRQIVEHGSSGGHASQAEPVSQKPSTECRSTCPAASPPVNHVDRRVLTCVDLPDARDGPITLASGREIRVTDDGAGLADAIVERLRSRGLAARCVALSPADTDNAAAPIGGLICVAPLLEASRPDGHAHADAFLLDAFRLARDAAHDLTAAAAEGGAVFATVSRMDGGFGLLGGAFDPTTGGLAGLAKTASHEWAGVRCRAMDVSATWDDIEAAAEAIVRELSTDGPIEIGLDRLARRGLTTVPRRTTPGAVPIGEGDVVVISGGARGVAAEAAYALAQRSKATLVLLGRSPAPVDEPDWLVGLNDETRIKRRILSREYGGTDHPSPAELQSVYRRHMANREILETLRRIESVDARVVYRSVDVRQSAALRSVLGDVRATVGPIHGFIHAAGVIDDRWIADKTPEQFRTVYDTKVSGLRNLIEATERDDLKIICLFSSVAARYGNAGQVDYAVANEVMNKLAHQVAKSRPVCRVVSINWGPWDGGMVGPELKRRFARRGVELIPLDAGGQAMVDELACTDRAAVEVVIGAGFGPVATTANVIETTALAGDQPLTLAFQRELDLERHAFLKSHILDARPVLPVAMIMEWLGHAALHANPGLVLHGFDDLRLFKGVVLDGRSRLIRFLTGRIRPVRSTSPSGKRDVDEGFAVDVELRDGGTGSMHARATAILTPSLPAAGNFASPTDWRLRPYERAIETAYSEVLFHGPHFHGIERVEGISSRGMIARLRSAPAPAEWMDNALRSAWLGDPLILDAAFQMAILWCHDEMGAVSLPSYIGRYRQYAPTFPTRGVKAVLEVREQGRHRMRGGFTFTGNDDVVVARIENYECTVNASLQEAFGAAQGRGVHAAS